MDVKPEGSAPESVRLLRSPQGLEITLLRLPRLKHTPRHLARAAIGAVILIGLLGAPFFGFLWAGDRQTAFLSLFLLAFGVVLGLLVLAGQFHWERDGAKIALADGIVTFTRGGGISPRSWKLSDLWQVRVLPANEAETQWELEIMLRDGAVMPYPRGRQKVELEWMAGVLRAARGKPPPLCPPVQGVTVGLVKGGECQVCGSPLEARLVYCVRCRTPHHEECWVYAGRCSTYGCQETRFFREA